MLKHQDRMMKVSSHGKKKAKERLEYSNTWTKTVTEQLQKEKSDHISNEKKQHWSREQEYGQDITGNTDCTKHFWYFERIRPICISMQNIYIHRSICIYVHIGTTVHMYIQSLTQLPFDKFQHLTLGANKNVAVVQNYMSVLDYWEVMVERPKLIPKQFRPRCGFINIAMGAQPLNISSSFVGIKYPRLWIVSVQIISVSNPADLKRWPDLSPDISGLAWGHPTQNTSLGTLDEKLNSNARTGLSFCKRSVSCPYSVLEERDVVHKKRDSPHPSNKGTHDNSENTCSSYMDMLIFGVSSCGMWKVTFSIKLACLTTPKSTGLPSPRLFLSDTSTLNWSLICVHYQRHIRAERKWWKKELQIDCSTPRQSRLPTPEELSSLLHVQRTPFNALHP